MRLSQFSGQLSMETSNVSSCFSDSTESQCLMNDLSLKQRLQLNYWNEVVNDFFMPTAGIKFTFWKSDPRAEAKPFGMSLSES